ncbi:hypothetical protein ACTFBT_08530 [Streptomyces microflavus]|uniref:Uncharacterized protein n=2 Tax=Streptomyces microflavus TaxID=1919 RepID=A0A7J0CKE8_STRMI|nr:MULTISPECIES: hypothetical protein [Streptomyces]AGK76351.1 hypothetical protein SFUL_1382 [Streptomyces microflavus DSM 40593]MDX2976223.1 hypothetical protein [Streptomyces sp. NRRL_B-2249]WSS37542.1 hypothetical protein OG269_30620 [Streptomyces microflavus]WST14029.1 hypothetical protein OG721_08635 [Streptomyces microflavus]GFN02960.1 hypothetical protein Smic_15160 [Streptomyces microflavus]
MTVPAHPRSRRPAPSPRPAPSSRPALPRHPAAARVEIRLPWWAVALPAVAFAALLLMIMSPGQAQAATADPALGQLIERTLHLLSR